MTNSLLNTIDYVIGDQSSSYNTVRIALLLLENLYYLNKQMTKSYLKKKTTFGKMLAFFERERSGMTEDELTELENAVTIFYGKREHYLLTRRHRKGTNYKKSKDIKV